MPARKPDYGACDLSADRANAVRQILEEEGVPTANFFMVAGKADTQPLFPDDPSLAANRRVTITLMREDPPLPRTSSLNFDWFLRAQLDAERCCFRARQAYNLAGPMLRCNHLAFIAFRAEIPMPDPRLTYRRRRRSHPNGSRSAAVERPAGSFWALTLGSIGVVYGDIGTSPLYAFREAVHGGGRIAAR